MKAMTNQRVAELSATLLPISQLVGQTPLITDDMWEEAEDCCSYNASYYCNGWIKPIYEGLHKGIILEKVDEFQVLRVFGISTKMEGLSYDEIPENWEDEDAPDFPDLELQGIDEYKQIWIDRNGNQTENILHDFCEYTDNDDTQAVCAVSMQDWVFDPNFATSLRKQINEREDGEYLDFIFCPCCEYLMRNEPQFATIFMQLYDKFMADKLFKSFKVAHRHGFQFPTNETLVRAYVDYLSMNFANNTSTNNPTYTNPLLVCPKDIVLAHDNLLAIRDEIRKREEENAMRLAEEEFAQNHAWLLGISFDNGHFQFTSLDSVEQYYIEGETMHHCIYRCGYYKKHDYLSMHISDMEGNRVATCTIDCQTRKIKEIQPISNDTGFFKTFGIEWKTTDDYKEIYAELCKRMHSFPRRKNNNEQVTLKLAV